MYCSRNVFKIMQNPLHLINNTSQTKLWANFCTFQALQIRNTNYAVSKSVKSFILFSFCFCFFEMAHEPYFGKCSCKLQLIFRIVKPFLQWRFGSCKFVSDFPKIFSLWDPLKPLNKPFWIEKSYLKQDGTWKPSKVI